MNKLPTLETLALMLMIGVGFGMLGYTISIGLLPVASLFVWMLTCGIGLFLVYADRYRWLAPLAIAHVIACVAIL